MDDLMKNYKRRLEHKARQHGLASYMDVPYTAAANAWTNANLGGIRRNPGTSVNYGTPPGYEGVDVPDTTSEWVAWYWEAKLNRAPGVLSAGLGPGMSHDPFVE